MKESSNKGPHWAVSSIADVYIDPSRCSHPSCVVDMHVRGGMRGLPGGLVVKNPPCKARDAHLIPGWGRKISYAAGLIIWHATTTWARAPDPVFWSWESLCATQKIHSCNKDAPVMTPVSMGCSRQEHCSGLPRPPPGDLPDPGMPLRWLHHISCSIGGFFPVVWATRESLKTQSPQINNFF